MLKHLASGYQFVHREKWQFLVKTYSTAFAMPVLPQKIHYAVLNQCSSTGSAGGCRLLTIRHSSVKYKKRYENAHDRPGAHIR